MRGLTGFSVRPRSGIARWGAWLLASAGSAFVGMAALTHVEGAPLVAVCALLGVVGGKLLAESVRRLHDIGVTGWTGLLPGIGIVALLVTAVLRWLFVGTDAVAAGALVLALIATALLLARRGDPSANRWGPPAPPNRSSGHAGGDGIWVALASLVAGIALGGGVLAWQDALREQSDARVARASAEAPLSPATSGPSPTATSAIERENARTSQQIDDLLNAGDPK